MHSFFSSNGTLPRCSSIDVCRFPTLPRRSNSYFPSLVCLFCCSACSRNVDDSLGRAVPPDPNDSHGEAQRRQPATGREAASQRLDLRPEVLPVDLVLDLLLARRLAVRVAQDLVARLQVPHGARGGRRLLRGWRGRRKGRRAEEEGRRRDGEGGEEGGVDEVRVAGGARGEEEGEEERRGGEGREGEDGEAEGGGEVREGVGGAGRGGEVEEGGEREGRDGEGDALLN